MSGCFGHAIGSRFSLLLLAASMLAACRPEAETAAPEVRPVRTVTVVKRESGETVAFTGRIEAENETRLAFRIGGRMIERAAKVGGRPQPGPGGGEPGPQSQPKSTACTPAGGAAGRAPICGSPERVRAPAISAGEKRQFPRAVRAGGAGHADSAGATRDGQGTIEIGRGPSGPYRIAGGYCGYRNHHLG